MTSVENIIVMITGIIFATLGIVLFAYFRMKAPPAETSVGFGGSKLKTQYPSLVVFVIGCVLIIAPFTLFKEQPVEEGFFEKEISDKVTSAGPSSYNSFVTIYDDTNSILEDVPTSWSDRLGTSWLFDGEEVGPAVSASADLDALYNTWSEPGVFFGASISLANTETVDSLLDHDSFIGYCDYEGRETYDDGVYAGKFDLWSDCGGIGTVVVEVSAEPSDGSFITYVVVQIVSEADVNALDNIFSTFNIQDAFWDWGS